MKNAQNPVDLQVYECTFEIHIQKAAMTIKFPCTFSVEIKSLSNKIALASTKQNVSAINSIAIFNETLKFQTELLYNNKQRQFIKKEALLLLNLVSVRTPDQQKLVGRVTIDLSEVIHTNNYTQLQSYKLDYCSVNANITFNIRFVGKRLSHTHPENFDRQSLTDLQQFLTSMHKDNWSKQRSEEESEKTIEMPRRSRASQGISKNKIIQQSYNEEGQSRANTGRASHKIVPFEENFMKSDVVLKQNQQTIGYNKFALISDLAIGTPYESNRLNVQYLRSSNAQHDLSNFSQTLSRAKSDPLQKSYSNKNFQPPLESNQQLFFTQPINQYQQILRHSHAQQKLIWDEEKRLMNEQILREKNQSIKYKQRNQVLQKKLYETELKMCSIEGKIENSKRQIAILEKEKDLQIKELKSRIDKTCKQKFDKFQQLQVKQNEIKELKEKFRIDEAEKKKDFFQLSKENQNLHQQLDKAQKQTLNYEQSINVLEREKKEKQDQLSIKQKKIIQQLTEINEQQNKLIQVQNSYIQQLSKIQQELTLKFDSQKQQLTQKIEIYQSTLSQNQFKLNDLAIQLQTKNAQLTQKELQLSQYVTKNKIIQEDQNEISKLNNIIVELEKNKSQLQTMINKLKIELQEKDEQIQSLIQQKCKDEQGNQHGEQSKQYAKALQESILELVQKLKQKQQINQQMNQEAYQLKIDKKQIQQKIENNEKLMEKINIMTENEKKNMQKYSELQESTNKRISELEKLIQKQNIQLNQKNHEFQKLSKDNKQYGEEYVSQLQNEILRLNTIVEQTGSKSEDLTKIEEQLKMIEIQNKEKEQQIEALNKMIRELKEYQGELEEQINKLQVEKMKISEQKETEEQAENPNQKSDKKKIISLQELIQQKQPMILPKLQQKQKQILQNNIIHLKQVIEQQKEYVITLQKQLAQLHETNTASKQKQLQGKLKSLQMVIEKQKQQNLKKSKIIVEPLSASRREEEQFQQMAQLQKRLQQQIQYAERLQQKILQVHDELTAEKNTQQDLKKKESQMVNKIKQLEGIISEKQHHQEELEKQVQQQHQSQEQRNRLTLNEAQLTRKLQELQCQIQHNKEYQEGLQQKILDDHEQAQAQPQVRINKQSQLTQRIKQLQKKIEYQKQYQHELEQKILDDHENVVETMKNGLNETEKELVNKIKTLQSTIERHKQYQEGLEQRILQDFDNKQNQDSLKSSIDKLTIQIQQQRQYQQGLQQKILTDHEKLQTMQKKYNLLLSTVNKKQNEAQQTKTLKRSPPSKQSKNKNTELKGQQNVYKKCLQQKKRLEQIIQQLEDSLYKALENAPARNREDEDYLVLQEKLNEKQTYIGELQLLLKNMQNQIYKLQEETAELYAEKEQFQQRKKTEEKKDHSYQNYHYEQAFGTVIRVISAHTPSQEGDDEKQQKMVEEEPQKAVRLTALMRRSIQKSQISQPPSLRQKQKQKMLELSEELSYKSTPKKKDDEKKTLEEVPKKSISMSILNEKEHKERQKERKLYESENILKTKQNQLLQAKLAIQARDLQIANSNKIIEELKNANQKLAKNAQSLKPNLKQESSIKKLQARLQQLQQQKEERSIENKSLKGKIVQLSNIQLQQDKEKDIAHSNINMKMYELKEYAELLEQINRQYEGKIKLMKDKQGRIQLALAIIEEESQKIVSELEHKVKEKDQLRQQLENKNKQYEQLQLKVKEILNNNNTINQQIQKDKQKINQLQNDNQKKNKEIEMLKQKILVSEQGNMQNSLPETERQKRDSERIKKLEAELTSVNRQLVTNRKLFAKIKVKGSSKESSTSVESDLKIATITEENKTLSKKIEDLQNETLSYKNCQDEKTKQISKLYNQIQFLSQQIKSQKSMNEVCNNLRTENAQLKKALDEKELKFKEYQTLQQKFSSLTKSAKLEHYNKRRGLIHEKYNLDSSDSKVNDGTITENKIAQEKSEEKNEDEKKLKKSTPKNKKKQEGEQKQLVPKKQQNMKLVEYIEELEKLIQANYEKIRQKNQEIDKLKSSKADEPQNKESQQNKQLQNQLNFYSQELAIMTNKCEQLESLYNIQGKQLLQTQREVEQLNIELMEKGNKLHHHGAYKNDSMENKRKQQLKQDYLNQRTALLQKLQQIQIEFDEYKSSMEQKEKENSDKVRYLDQKLRQALDEKGKAMEELEEKQMEHMNTELDLQFRLREKNEKSQVQIAKSMSENQNKKSLNTSQEVGTHDLLSASKILKDLILNRSNKNVIEQQIQFMVVRIAQLEDQLFNSALAVKQKSLILQKTRLLSMQLSKFKVNMMKFNLAQEERIKFLSWLRPLQMAIKDILRVSEIYIENLLSQDFAVDNFNNN